MTRIFVCNVKRISNPLLPYPWVYLSAHNDTNSNIIALNTSSQHSKRLVTSQKIGSIAFDPLTANLFWIDVVKSAVMIHNVKNDNQMELLQSLDVPQCLLFVPEINRLVIAHKGSRQKNTIFYDIESKGG